MLVAIESNMKKAFHIKCFDLILGVTLCFLTYLLVSLIISPLIGTQKKVILRRKYSRQLLNELA